MKGQLWSTFVGHSHTNQILALLEGSVISARSKYYRRQKKRERRALFGREDDWLISAGSFFETPALEILNRRTPLWF